MIIESALLENSFSDFLRLQKNSFSHSYSKSQILERLKDKKYWLCFAVEGNKKMGLNLWYDQEGKSYCWILCVDAECRRKGIARKLLEEQEKVAKKEGFKVVLVKTFAEFAPMVSLLKSKGYLESGREEKHPLTGLESIFFEKRLI